MSTHPFTACPVSPPEPAAGDPALDTLTCSLTVPGAPYSAQIARAAVRSVLHTYRLDPLAPAALQVTGELVAAAWHLDPGRSLYLSVRYRDDSLRLTVYDGHAPHTHPRLAAHCEARRRVALRLMGAVVRECGGRGASVTPESPAAAPGPGRACPGSAPPAISADGRVTPPGGLS